jgi:hypothetical protein
MGAFWGLPAVPSLLVQTISWLQEDYELHVNPLNVGQIVNNQSSSQRANISYEEFDLIPDSSYKILRLLPNINYESAAR